VLLLLGEYGGLTLEDLKSNLETIELPEDVPKEWLNFPGIKIFADGIPPTMTSWMNEDFLLGGHGSSVIPGKTEREQADNLTEMISFVHSKGFQVGVHATGDRAIDVTIDGLVKCCNEIRGKDLRH
jgi:predicted amidohydrolase YtcJ